MIKIQDEKGKTLWQVEDDGTGLPTDFNETTVESKPVEEETKKEGE